ncbi:MAG: chemotaxis protein CheA [Firmicutes bacterium]|nr:chemotaxis protein CheA [Bacillota bacterium]
MEEYRDLFLAEAQEYLQNMTDCMLELEKDPTATENLTEMFRAAHSLKGMSGTMGYELIMKLTHEMENLLDKLRSGEISVGTDLVNLLFEAVDLVQVMINDLDNQKNFSSDVQALEKKLQGWYESAGKEESRPLEKGIDGENSPEDQETERDAAAKDAFIKAELNEFEKEMLKDAASRGENSYHINVWLREGSLLKSVRSYMVYKVIEKHGEIVKTYPSMQAMEEEKFDRDFSFLLLGKPDLDINELEKSIKGIAEVEKVIISSLFLEDGSEKAAPPLQEAQGTAGANAREKRNGDQGGAVSSQVAKKVQPSLNRSSEKTVRVETAKLDALVNLVGELIINRTRVLELGKQFKNENLEASLEQLERVTTELQSAVMTLRMVPIKQVFDRFPRMVRDLSQERGKEIELIISGEETELDRTIVNQIGDPLVHLLRNAVDHGIEDEEERKRKGKRPVGTIHLEAHHEGSHVVVSVEDDGSGIDPEKVKEKAVQKNIITREEAEVMEADEAIRLIFRSGFSTSAEVTDISGRGVGMDVVKTSIEALNGTVEVKSEQGKGSKFILRLPLTLAIIRTLMVRAGEEVFAIPIEAIRENLFVEPHEIRTIQQGKVITLREEVLPLYCLKEELGMGFFEEQEVYPVVVVQAGEKKAGFIVDELMGQQEVVIKSLSSFINDIKGVAGATVLGDGRVTLILDIAGLLEDGRVNVGKENFNH